MAVYALQGDRAVERQFPVAEVLALRPRGVIQVAQVDRLLGLIGILSGEEDEGHLRLHQVDTCGMLGISIGFQQRLDIGRQIRRHNA